MTNGERYKIFKGWFESIGFPEMHSSYKDAMWQGFEAGHRSASNVKDAGPELLEALQEIIGSGFYLSGDLHDMAEEAIKKALGE